MKEAQDNVGRMRDHALTAMEKSPASSEDKLAMMMFAPIIAVPFLFMASSARDASRRNADDHVFKFGERNKVLLHLGKERHCAMLEIPTVGEIRADARHIWTKRQSVRDESNLNDGPDFGERAIVSDSSGTSDRMASRTPNPAGAAAGRATIRELMIMFLHGDIDQEEYNRRKAQARAGKDG